MIAAAPAYWTRDQVEDAVAAGLPRFLAEILLPPNPGLDRNAPRPALRDLPRDEPDRRPERPQVLPPPPAPRFVQPTPAPAQPTRRPMMPVRKLNPTPRKADQGSLL